MLPSSGYFRSVNCPYFVSGLCERPHCHYRHVKPDAQQTWQARRSSVEDGPLPGTSVPTIIPQNPSLPIQPPQGPDLQPDLLKLVADAIRQVQKEVEEDQARFVKSITLPIPSANTTSTLINPTTFLLPTVTPTPVPKPQLKTAEPPAVKKSVHFEVPPPVTANIVPEYKPTPISELRKMRQALPPLPSANDTKSDSASMEYDPVCNYSASLNPVSKRSSTKETVGYVPTTKRKLEKPPVECVNPKMPKVEETVENPENSDSDGSLVISVDGFADDAGDTDSSEKETKEEVKEEIVVEEKDNEFDLVNSILSQSVKCSTLISAAKNRNDVLKVKNKIRHEGKAVDDKSSVDSGIVVEKKPKKKTVTVKEVKRKDGETVEGKKPKVPEKKAKSKSENSAKVSTKKDVKKDTSGNKEAKTKTIDSNNDKSKNKKASNKTSTGKKTDKKVETMSKTPSKITSKTKVVSGSGPKNGDSKAKSKPTSKTKSSKKAKVVKSPVKKVEKVKIEEQKMLEVEPVPVDVSEMEISEVLEVKAEPVVVEDDPDTDLDEHDTYEECLKIFNEYTPSGSDGDRSSKKVLMKDMRPKGEDQDNVVVGKKRIAHGVANSKPAATAAPLQKRVSASEAMHNRFVQSQIQAQKLKTQKPPSPLPPPPPRTPSPPPPPPSEPYPYALTKSPLSKPGASASNVMSQILKSVSMASSSKRRIAHVPTAIPANLLTRKEKTTRKSPAQPEVTPTAADNASALKVTKGVPRVAHPPTAVTASRPTIPVEFGSKVPSNIRQRYLNIFIDECLKIYDEQQDAFDRALAEEKSAYDRSTNRMVYLNVTVNSIKKLRSERAATASNNKITVSPKAASSTTAKPTAGLTPLSQSLNRKLSHEFVLGGRKAVTTSYSIERPKNKKVGDVSGAALYVLLKSYVLTPEQLEEHGFPFSHPSEAGRAVIKSKDNKKRGTPIDRLCCRCGTPYQVDLRGYYFKLEECVYHYGKPWKKKVAGALETSYSCCGGELHSSGCCVGKLHVSDNCDLDNLRGFVKTLPRSPPLNGNCGVYALDCEMCYTTMGCELTRITVIGPNLKPVYESLVKPENPVIDYNTQFSGIKEEDMRGVVTTIRDVQAVLLNKFGSETILIGHSLESDFKALKLIHGTVVDTGIVFPHKRGLPYKRALRTLMAEYLKKLIQNDVGGHDSNEDAAACMELMLWKVKEDAKKSGS